jgi:radical SAM superfamily enzyme YgiQ (UPF0313 family)
MQCREIPLSLAYLAAVLKRAGHEALIYNADISDEIPQAKKMDLQLENFKHYQASLYDVGGRFWQEVGEAMRGQNPDIVGIHMKTASFKSGVNLATLVKRHNPRTKVIVGGPHPSMVPEGVLKETVFDYLVLHEGEIAMVNLVNALAAGREPTDVKGIAYRDGAGKVVRTPAQEAIQDLDSGLPFPDRDAVLRAEQYVPDSYGLCFTSRGCPFECIYCDSPKFWGRKVRYRSPANVVAEMVEVAGRYQTRYFKFYDDTWTLNQKRGIEICETLIKSGLPAKGVTWQCTTRADCLGDDLARAMKAAGCAMVNIGLETASDRVLKVIKKGETKEEIAEGVRLLQRHEVPVNLYVMMGLPTETKADVEETMAFAHGLKPNSLIPSIATPYPGTELFEVAQREGFIQSDLDWAEFFHQSPKMGLSKDISHEDFMDLKDRFLKDSDRYNTTQLKLGMIRRGSVLLLRDPRTFARKFVRKMLPAVGPVT